MSLVKEIPPLCPDRELQKRAAQAGEKMVSRIIFKGRVMGKTDLLLYINPRLNLYVIQCFSLAML